MLKGKELGIAIREAIRLKIESGAVRSKAEIARHFDIKPPSIHDWIKKGSISKDKLPELWRYFSDVVDMEHWGIEKPKLLFDPSSIKIETRIAGPYCDEDGNPLADVRGLLNFDDSDSSLDDVHMIRDFNTMSREDKDEFIRLFRALKTKREKEKKR